MSAKLHLHAAPATAVSLAVILALAVTGLVALSSASTSRSRASGARRSAPAASPQPQCGDTITTDTTLHHNLINCPHNGIIIGADNITLDLNYHTIDGDGISSPECECGVVNEGHDGVTVVHGSVREFDGGVFVLRASHNRLLGISSSRNVFFGLGFFRATRSLMRNSSGNGSITPEDGTGMFLAESHHVRIVHNSFRDNGDRGIAVSESAHNLVKRNRLSRNPFGIVLEGGAERNQVRRNGIVGGHIGIYLAPARRNVIARNRISHNRGAEASGIEIDGGGHNLFARNSIRDTGRQGIDVGFVDIPDVGNVVRRNHIRGAGEDGVFVDDKAKHTRLKRNHAFGAKDDGLDANNPTTKLTRNEARRNGDLGIEAVRGVIDGGGNRASGNGDLRQCTNIVCT